MKSLNILGIRGIPAAHGGFETFAEHFAPFMREKGWSVTVYCQDAEGVSRPRMWEDSWNGIRRIHFETRSKGSLATIEFDLRATLHVLRQPGVDLVLGYNTAIFTLLQRAVGRRVVMNMDGIEWKRQKWGRAAKAWFWLNEWIGLKFVSVAIADHPKIAEHLSKRGRTGSVVIPYGSENITGAPTEALRTLGVEPEGYFVSIARIEPENSILEMVRGFVAAKTGRKFVVLGKLLPETNTYHASVLKAADENVIFPGAIYDQSVVQALRVHCLAYMHGHQVGGTNPSLVEALGAGSPVIAHGNGFNRWTAGERQLFFTTVDECSEQMKRLSGNADMRNDLRSASRLKHQQAYQFEKIHQSYLDVIDQVRGAV